MYHASIGCNNEDTMIKPLIAAFVLPPAGPILCALLGLFLIKRFFKTACCLIFFGIVILWILSCQSVAIALSDHLLKNYPTIDVSELKDAQAIVILGGGSYDLRDEYKTADLSEPSHARLRYGLWLADQIQLPVLFSGGIGHGAPNQKIAEAQSAQIVALRHYKNNLRWMEMTSRDTQENAQNTWTILEKEGIKKIVLVTTHVHVQRSVAQFQKVGFEVRPAPTGKFMPSGSALLHALPSTNGLQNSRQVLHEWLAILVTVER